MKVIDTHVHYWKEIGWFPPGLQWDIALVAAKEKWPYKDPNEVLKTGAIGSKDYVPLDPDGSWLVQDQKDAGINVSFILPVDWGGGYKEDAAVPIEEINKESCALAKKYPGKVYSYCGVDPRRPHAVKLFEKAVTEWGAKGLKLYPPCGFFANDPVCFPLYKKATELGVPITFHQGFTIVPSLHSRPTQPKYLDDVARLFPDLNIIIAHSAIMTICCYGWWEEAMGVAKGKYNIHLDLAAWNEKITSLIYDIPELIRRLRIQCDIVGAHRVLFATDLPGYQLPEDREGSIKFVELMRNLVEIGKEHGAVFSQEEVELMAHGNAERLHGI